MKETAKGGLKEKELAEFLGCTLALDASLHLYQFLAAIRTGTGAWNLTNASGEATSHIQGFANRTVKLVESGVRPIFVFDGASPALKATTLRDRSARKRQAAEAVQAAREDETKSAEEVYKAASAATRVTRKHNDDVKQLLRLMGVPVVEAPGEAEASCAALARAGLADAVATEDMDALAFGAPVMIKNLFDTEGARTGTSRPAFEIRLDGVLASLAKARPKLFGGDDAMAAFVDFCILCGCDYLDHIAGVGPSTAAKALEAHGASLDRAVVKQTHGRKTASGKLIVPVDWDFEAARDLFHKPDVVDPGALDLAATAPDYPRLRAFLVDDHGFAPDRVDKLLARLRKARAAKPQRRIDAFFQAATTVKRPLEADGDGKKEEVPPSEEEGVARAPASVAPLTPPPAAHKTKSLTPATTSSKKKPQQQKKAKLPPPGARITSFFSKGAPST